MYNDEEDLAFKSVVLVRGEEYDASIEIRRIKDSLERHKNDLHALLLDERVERSVHVSKILKFEYLLQINRHRIIFNFAFTCSIIFQ